MQLAAPVEPRLGFLVDPNGLSATCRSDAFLSRTLATLRAREALDVLDYPGSAGTSPMLVAYGAAEADWGLLLRECPERVDRTRRAPVATLCALLAKLADQRDFAGAVFAEVALALRAAHAPSRVDTAAWRVPGGLAPWQSERAMTWMEERLDAAFTSAEVAALFGMSAGHFTRAFRITQGISPRQWILQRRVERAKTLLPDTSVSLTDVALICGFSEQSHFTRVFARLVGMPPGAWRRRLHHA
ncbi:AraC family transcriptional regulator [Luteibacter sp. 621]|uniref:helix-turn-helix transcriptional regulator n=1 Tax=Luteibacter sp. 621 TaxID=3373916 RepID=UPI003D2241C9